MNVLVGNPRPESRTLDAARQFASALAPDGELVVTDLATLGAEVLDYSSPRCTRIIERVQEADLVVVASPVYKASYAGLLKVFLDRFATGTGITATTVAIMVGGAPQHALVPELLLKPLLVELGAVTPTPGLFIEESSLPDPGDIDDYITRWGPTLLDSAHAHRARRPPLIGLKG